MSKIDITYEGRMLQTVSTFTKVFELENESIVNITKIEGLDQLVNLQDLRLQENKIRKIEGLDRFVNLQKLDLGANAIPRIEGLAALANLQELRLSGNQIQRIEGLAALANLHVLWLTNNKIQKIEGLERLVNLKELHLETNQIQRIEGLDAIANLEHLYITENQISRIEGLERLVNLKELDIDDEAISGDMHVKIDGLRNDETKARFLVEYCMNARGMPVKLDRGQEKPRAGTGLQDVGDQKLISKIQQIIKVSNSMEITRLASVLKIDETLLWDHIFDWAEQFGFRIEESKVIFGQGNTGAFIDELDKQFAAWNENARRKDGKN